MRVLVTSFLGWFLLLAGLLTCSEEKGQGEPCDPSSCAPGFRCPTDPGEGNECVPDPGFCSTNNDCPLSEYCDRGRCVPIFEPDGSNCQTDDDCSAGLTCTLGLCTGCVDDIQCGAGGVCLLGVCFSNPFDTGGDEVNPCDTVQCGQDQICVEATGQCVPTCDEDQDCQEEEICDLKQSRCVPAVGCQDDSHCQPGTSCVFGVCVGCTNNNQCRQNETCAFGVCVAPPDLEQLGLCEGVECPEGDVCNPLTGDCYDGTCQKDEDCPEDQVCTVLGLCASCVTDEDCADGESCAFLLGECYPNLDRLGRCRDVTCPGNQLCNPLSGLCEEVNTCDVDEDCPDDQICTALGTCAECTVDEDCQPSQFCDWATGTCQTACTRSSDCPEGEQCALAINVCIPEFGCNTAEDCIGDQGCLLGVCVGCVTNAECRINEVCFLGVCLPDLGPFGLCEGVECDQDEYCSPVTGRCTAYSGCGEQGCPEGLTCNALGLCAGCDDRYDCRADESCVTGTCLPDRPFLSTPDGLCEGVTCETAGQDCVPNTGICEPVCDEDEDCDLERDEYCDPQLDPLRCIPRVGCVDSGDCRLREICLAGLCVGCQSADECRPGEACIVGICAAPADLEGLDVCGEPCDPGEVCNPLTGTCVPTGLPVACTNDDECVGEQTCSILGLCTGCDDENPCAEDYNCVAGTCLPTGS